MKYRNHYNHCATIWSDESDSMNNDRCPICNHEIEPYKSLELATREMIDHGENTKDAPDPDDWTMPSIINRLWTLCNRYNAGDEIDKTALAEELESMAIWLDNGGKAEKLDS